MMDSSDARKNRSLEILLAVFQAVLMLMIGGMLVQFNSLSVKISDMQIKIAQLEVKVSTLEQTVQQYGKRNTP